MRHTRLLALSAGLLLFVAGCSDQTGGALTGADAKAHAPGSTPAQTLIDQLFTGGLHQAASAKLANVDQDLAKGHTKQAERAAGDLMDFIFLQLRQGKLVDPNGPNPPTTQAAVASLACELRNELSPSGPAPDCASFGDFAGGALQDGGVVGIIGPDGGTLTTTDHRQGISVPPGAINDSRVFVIDPIPPLVPQSGPLPEPRCVEEFEQNCDPVAQFPLFAAFSVVPAAPIGEPDFNTPVTVGLCHLDPGDGAFAPPSATVEARLRIGHGLEVVDAASELQVLPKTGAPFLDCASFNSGQLPPPPVVGVLGRALRTVANVARPVIHALMPADAQAATNAACCLGGLATKLSPFGAVDPGTPLAPQDPANEYQFSPPGEAPSTEVIFANHTSSAVRVYQIGYEGRQYLTTLEAGRTYDQQTLVGQALLVTDDSECPTGLAIYVATNERGFAEFTGPAGQGYSCQYEGPTY